ncbi:Hypothetical predicted protein [Octopus vulgaris]|uniref:Uncharacterized protein n=1 Tax=Octopus vulgaris TaxID=6645 RepID=A0AA36B324_OCTVU|nr:Hypothetical predicted protein [Octopus vulgaris]
MGDRIDEGWSLSFGVHDTSGGTGARRCILVVVFDVSGRGGTGVVGVAVIVSSEVYVVSGSGVGSDDSSGTSNLHLLTGGETAIQKL